MGMVMAYVVYWSGLNGREVIVWVNGMVDQTWYEKDTWALVGINKKLTGWGAWSACQYHCASTPAGVLEILFDWYQVWHGLRFFDEMCWGTYQVYIGHVVDCVESGDGQGSAQANL